MRPYKVQRGDNLSTLAARFHIALDALVRVNKKQSNPNSIREGEILRIPRTRQGYDELIGSLRKLAQASERDFKDRMSELHEIEREGEVFGDRIDLAADIATGFVGVGKAAISYGGVVRNAAIRKETFDIAQKIITYGVEHVEVKDRYKHVKEVGDVQVKALGSATADQYLRIFEGVAPTNKIQFGKEFGKGVVCEGGKAIADHVIKNYIAVDRQITVEILVNIAIQAAFTGLSKAGDVVGFLSPSNLAHFYIRLRTGTDLRTTISDGRQALALSNERVRTMLAARIAAAKADLKEAYGS